MLLDRDAPGTRRRQHSRWVGTDAYLAAGLAHLVDLRLQLSEKLTGRDKGLAPGVSSSVYTFKHMNALTQAVSFRSDRRAACYRHRQRLRRTRRRYPARRSRLPRDDPRAPPRARRPRLRLPPRRFRLRRRPHPSSPHPDLLEELWTLCGRTPRRRRRAPPGRSVLPHPLPRRPRLRLPRRRRRHARRNRPLRTRRRRLATTASWPPASRSIASASSNSATCRSCTGPTWPASRPTSIRLGGWRSVHGLVSKFIKNDRLRTVLSFHPAPGRRQSVLGQRHLRPDRLARAQKAACISPWAAPASSCAAWPG